MRLFREHGRQIIFLNVNLTDPTGLSGVGNGYGGS